MTTRGAAVPPVIDGFADLVEIGRGGFGVVYRARQLDPARDVAVKVLPDVRADSDAYGRFTREFQALAALGGHPSIATVHACGVTADGSGYLALELLESGSLGERLRAEPAAWADAAAWGVQLAGALETAHRAGITHRDIKPENVLFDAAGTPTLVDFGIAGVPGAYRTATGSVTLTLAHAAPEVVAGGRGGVPGDIYSLASTIYAAIAGRAAFASDSDETLVPMLARIATAAVPDLRPRGVPDPVCRALERAMAKDPADRPASAEAWGMSLQAALVEEGVPCAPPLLLHEAGVAAPFVVAAEAPAPGTRRAGPAVEADGEHTLTGWVAPATPGTGAAASRDRRSSGWWAAAASLAAVLALLLVWRGFDAPAPAAAGSVPDLGASGQRSTASAAPSPSPSASSIRPSRSPQTSTSPAPGRNAVLVVPRTAASSSRPRGSSTTSSTPSSTPSTKPSPSPSPVVTPPVTSLRPLAPRRVRAAGGYAVRDAVAGAPQVSVRLAWAPAKRGPAATAYEVRWTPIGTSAAGAPTVVATVATTTATVLVPAPATGIRYRWQVRAVLATETSGWTTSRAAVPQLVGRKPAPARTALRALGLGSSTYRLPVDATASIGRVAEQSLPRGRLVPVGTSIALGIGTAR
jgi:serine/threonine protein kinase